MQRQDVVEVVGTLAGVVILAGAVSVIGRPYGWPLYLVWAIAGPPSGWALQIVGRRIQRRVS